MLFKLTRERRVSDFVESLLACPYCGGPLLAREQVRRCAGCGDAYPDPVDGPLDLRPRRTKHVSINFKIDSVVQQDVPPAFLPIPFDPAPAIDPFSVELDVELSRGNRLTPQLLSYFPCVAEEGAILDLGCGGEPFRKIADLTHLHYVGIDHDDAPNFLADAHALPFKDRSFSCAMSFAVLEHVSNPYVALREVTRVLKPGGRFIGTVAFLEPYHLQSHFHMSGLGTWSVLRDAGLAVDHIEPNRDWMNLAAQAWMSLFPHSPMALSRLAVLPLELLHRLWWKIGDLLQHRAATSEQARLFANTAGFRFVCHRPA